MGRAYLQWRIQETEIWDNGTDVSRNEANESMCKSSLLKEKENESINLRNGNPR